MGLETMNVPDGGSPLHDELMRRVQFLSAISDSLSGLVMPLSAMVKLHNTVKRLDHAKHGDTIPVMVGLDAVAICIYWENEKTGGQWQITPLLSRNKDLAPEDAAASVTVAIFQDAIAEEQAKEHWTHE